MRPAQTPWALACVILSCFGIGGETFVHGAPSLAVKPEVQLRLRMDEAGDHVIGDRIPLFWEFTNLSTNALGFLWEGCCRINGRLSATAPGITTEVVPPGQALAHAFAKAERLLPGVPRAFDTALADWVQLKASGTYQLEGTYTGVQPTQKPQIPRGLALWTSASSSEPVKAHVWTVADYLSQRTQREKIAGVQLSITGPDHIDPVRRQVFGLRVTNAGNTPLHLPREDLFALWLVRKDGTRCSAPGSRMPANDAELTLEPGQSKELSFEVGPETFEGEIFGDFTIFVDVRQVGSEKRRAPSNPLRVHWSLGKPEISKLLAAASSGARTGARNAPLKLLRTHLQEVAPLLQDLEPIPSWSPRTEALRMELLSASELTALTTVQGKAWAKLKLDESSSPTWLDAPVKRALGAQNSWPSALDRLLTLRRHVGLELSLRIEPSPATPLSQVLRIRSDLDSRIPNLADAPQWVLETSSTSSNSPARGGSQLTVLASTESAELGYVLELSRTVGGIEATWSSPSAQTPGAGSPPSSLTRPRVAVRGAEDLAKHIAATPRPPALIGVRAGWDMRWSEVLPWLLDLGREGHPLALQIRDTSPIESQRP